MRPAPRPAAALDVALADIAAAAGPGAASADGAAIDACLTDWRGRRLGGAALLLRPADGAAVAAIVRACGQHGIAVVPQGGRTGLVGGALPVGDRPAVLLSLDRLDTVGQVDAPGLALTVGAGVTLAAVHAAAEASGLRFPLNLAARSGATVGGLVATNAGGTQALRHGTMRARVLGLEVVLADGSLLSELSPLRKNTSGYDLKGLIIGSEGTLGIVTAATLALAPEPAERAAAWIGLASPAAALALLAALRARADIVDSFELLPGDAGALVAARVGHPDPLPGHAWCALVELAGDGALDFLTAVLADSAPHAVVAADAAAIARLWAVREALPEAERRDGPAIKHDIALPVGAVPAFLAAATPAVEAAWPGTRVLAFGHLGDGNLHYNLRPPPGVDRAAWVGAHGADVNVAVHDLVLAHGGAIAAEHGIGAFKAAELARTAPPAKLAAMRAIKAALDPLNILNPGKLAL